MNAEPDSTRQLLYRLMAENRQHARLSEDRRIFISCVTVLAASGILIALTVGPPGLRSLPLALWLVAIGVFGAITCLKLYERAQFHERRAQLLRARLIEMTPAAQAQQAQAEAESAHISEHPRIARVRLNSVLVGLNLAASLAGLLYTALDVAHR